MDFPGFHPLVARWFRETLGAPTSAQERGWAAIRDRRHTLIAAPTGSGKTLAAFLTAIDDLVQEGLQAPLPDEVRVVYVSPLKALSADIHKNLAEPRQGIRELAASLGIEAPRITAAVRTGDTTPSERAAMLRTPPHILVTTPESLYLLLTSARSREKLRTVRTVIVDEIHAVIGGRRGAHLALSLERLEGIVEADFLQRIGLSATQKPIEEVARFLVGNRSADLEGPARTIEDSALRRGPFRSAVIVDEGHGREIDLAIEIPRSPLDAVMSHEVWQEYYDRLTELISAHKTTLVFVNTRKMAERTARHLSERLGEHAVTAHHGSLSKEIRLDAEHRLKTGTLKALVATASLELGIDIGHVDLVCQIGSPHRIATLLQRVGRSGHTIAGTPKGRLMPVSRDDLIECAALLRSIRLGELDRIVTQEAPLDVLAQQIAAEVATTEYGEDDLFAFVRRAWPYRSLSRSDFDAVVGMLSDGFATKRGRRAALVHRDEVHAVLKGRRGTRMLALTSGGAIPEVADYRVVLEPEDTFVGTLNEDFAIESNAGDVFQLGNTSWQITQVVAGSVRVRDAHGAPPTIPFWLGEAPARSDELSRAVSDLRADVEKQCGASLSGSPRGPEGSAPLVEWLQAETGLCPGGAEQAASYLLQGRAALGVIPTQETLVLERFFDQSGGMQLVLHAPFGSRINKAWTLALRKRFCRQFNFELQAAATEDALLLSLGPQHSFPLSDVFRYLHPASTHDILVQALLDAAVFKTRWRWNTTISLAVPRSRGGAKVPPQLQRMQADDLMAAVFPDAAACLENIPGDRELPDHPLVNQTVRDCLDEAMDFNGLIAVLTRIHAGELRCVSRDTPEPSAFAHEIVNAKPYAFLDDAPLEERRTHAVQTRMASDQAGSEMSALDASAIERVQDEERPDPRDADELHDALLTVGFLRDDEITVPATLLTSSGRATRARIGVRGQGEGVRDFRIPDPGPRIPDPSTYGVWIAAERLPEFLAVHPSATLEPIITAPPSRAARLWTRETAIVELLRDRLSIVGPTTAAALAESLTITDADADIALRALEAEGAVLRGHFSPEMRRAPRQARGVLSVSKGGPSLGAPNPRGDGDGAAILEWCDRRLLARIHRYTLNRLRAEISAVTPSDFMRFLFAWQHLEPSSQLTGIEGLREVLAQLDGVEAPARAWERDVLAARLDRYDPAMLDMLCLTGTIAWARLSAGPASAPRNSEALRRGLVDAAGGGGPAHVVGATPIALFLREHADAWLSLAGREGPPYTEDIERPFTGRLLDHLRIHGASFANELAAACDLNDEQLHAAIADLVAAGAISSDGFAGLRSIVGASPNHSPARFRRADASGRWFALRPETTDTVREAAIETLAWTLLRRYGIVFRRVLTRDAMNVPWRELARIYRRLEARGEIRGGRFVSGMSGEQFALPEAVERLREVRRSGHNDRLMTIGATDPLNLSGIITGEERIRASASNRLVYRNGVPVAAMEGDMLRVLSELDPDVAMEAAAAAAGRRVPVVSGYVGRR